MRIVVGFAGAIAGLALVSAPLAAQAETRAYGVEIAPYGGYMIFGDYIKGPLGTSIGSAGGPVFGAQLGIALGTHLSLVGNVGRASGDIEIGLPLLGGLPIGSSTVWMYDGGLQLKIPMRTAARSIEPFVQIGAGGMHHTITGGVIETTASNFAANVGVGADLALSPQIAVRLFAKDYIGRFDFEEATSMPADGELGHNFAFSAGFRIGF